MPDAVRSHEWSVNALLRRVISAVADFIRALEEEGLWERRCFFCKGGPRADGRGIAHASRCPRKEALMVSLVAGVPESDLHVLGICDNGTDWGVGADWADHAAVGVDFGAVPEMHVQRQQFVSGAASWDAATVAARPRGIAAARCVRDR